MSKDEIPALVEQYSSAKNADLGALKLRLDEVRIGYESSKNLLGGRVIDVSELEKARQIKETVAQLEDRRADFSDRFLEISRENATKDVKKTDKFAFLSLVFALLAVLCAIFAISLTPWIWLLFAAASCACAVSSVLFFKNRSEAEFEKRSVESDKKKLDVEISELKETIQDLEDQLSQILEKYGQSTIEGLEGVSAQAERCADLEREYSDLLQKYNEEKAKVSTVNEAIAQKLSSYASHFDGCDVGQMLIALSGDLERLEYLKTVLEKQNEQANFRISRINEAKSRLWECVSSLITSGVEAAEIQEAERIYNAMMLDLSSLPKIEGEMNELKNALDSAKETEETDVLQSDTERDEEDLLAALAQTKARSAEADALRQELQGNLVRLESALEVLYFSCDDIPVIEQEIDELSQKYNSANEEYNTVTKTAEYLEKAKNSLMSRYLGAIRDNFESVFCAITEQESGAVRLDSRLALKFERDGVYRDVQYFSRGYRDIMDFALRIALIKTIFASEEPPFILLDDPFASLDEKHLAIAKQCVLQISTQYQVIYTVCDRAREITK